MTHPHAKLALQSTKRDQVTILTKTHATSEAEMRADLDRFRRELGTDYLDIVLLHNMQSPGWPQEKAGAMAVLSEAKEKGIWPGSIRWARPWTATPRPSSPSSGR